MTGNNGDRLAHIDVLRALAAMLVVIHHFVSDTLKIVPVDAGLAAAVEKAAYDFIDLGRYGVLLFFIISGYCIAKSILRPSRYPIIAFAANRVARIYPAYWLSLVLGVATFGAPRASDLLANVFLVQYFLGRPEVLGVYWTLAIEFIFYVLCIALFVAGLIGTLRRLTIVWLALLAYSVTAAVARATFDVTLPYAVAWFMTLMVGGAILRRFDDGDRHLSGWAIFCGGALVILSALVISICIYADPAAHDKSWQRDFGANALAICSFLIVNYRCRINVPALVYLGRMSYSIYLFHLIVFAICARLFAGALQGSGVPGAILLFSIDVAATLTFAAASYHVVEAAGIGLGRRVTRFLRGVPLDAQVAPEHGSRL